MSSKLFSSIRLKNLELPNRIVIPPMCQYSSVNGKASDWHMIHLGHLVLSGAGLLIVEATAVEPEGRISPADLGLWDDETAEALADVIRVVRQNSATPLGIQLAHAGRKASTAKPWEGDSAISRENGGWETVAPSAVPYRTNDATPRELTSAAVESLISKFAEAAKRACHIGFDVIEIHAAHGYLLHEFLSPLSNRRTDDYGGTLENRMRIVLQVFKAVRNAVPENQIVGIRISATDWVQGGWNVEESIVLARQLESLGCDYIHVSSGGLSMEQKIPVGPNYQVPLARRIKEQVSMPVIAVGLVTEPEQAEAIVATGEADMVAIGRGILFDPRWPWHAAAKLGVQIPAPSQYLLSAPHSLKKLFVK